MFPQAHPTLPASPFVTFTASAMRLLVALQTHQTGPVRLTFAFANAIFTSSYALPDSLKVSWTLLILPNVVQVSVLPCAGPRPPQGCSDITCTCQRLYISHLH